MLYAQQAEEFIIDYRITIVAIIAICVVESIALFQGVNGVLLTAVVGILAALAGLSRPIPNFLKGGKKTNDNRGR